MTHDSDLRKTLYPIGLVDGRAVRVEGMGVPLHGPSAQYAITLFEGLIGYPLDGGIGVVALREHFQRLLDGALKSELGFDRDCRALERLIWQGMEALPELLRTNAVSGAVYIRPTLYHQGTGNVCLGPALEGDVHLGIYLQRWDGYLAKKPEGQSVLISPYLKVASPVAHLKCSANYGLAIPAKREACIQGYDEILFRDAHRRHVAEASSQNLLVDFQGRVATPHLIDRELRPTPILPGITLRILREAVGPDLGISIEGAHVPPKDLFGPECLGAALCGTATEIRRIGRIDWWPKDLLRRTYEAPSEALTALAEGYAKLTRGEAYRDWLTVISL